ncbi:MAG: 50S ribosomal protein L10 [Deltaproteobacteria bacterium]|nr:50S ribosomal protein L10 [Deltaproteobacteria bacterium]MBW2308594.1 50S ribosomal protein L10 [Deltaproteobacteria bacterium]
MNRAEKEAFVANLHEKLVDSKFTVLVDYMGLNVEKMTELRRILKRSGIELKVVKNTLMRLAARGTAFEGLEEHFMGPKALVVSQADPSVSTKLLIDFEKSNPELKVHAGILDVQKLLRPQLEELASLPGREVLLAQTLQCMNAPMANFARVLSGVARQFIQVIEAIRQTKEKEQGSEA